MAPMDHGSALHESRANRVIATMVATRCLAWITVALRFRAKKIGGMKYGLDDWTILSVATLLLPQMLNEIVALKLGMGKHLEDILETDPGFYHGYLRCLYVSMLFYPVIIGLTKLSILSLYVRLFGVRRKFAIICYIQMGIEVAWILATILVTVFQCSPVGLAFELEKTGGKCIKFTNIGIGTNTIDVVMCFAILITPLHSIWNLHLSRRKRMLVTLALLFGGGETIFSIIRLVVIPSISYADMTWANATSCMWSTIQENAGVLCACIPVMGPLLPSKWMNYGSSRLSSGRNDRSGSLSSGSKEGARVDVSAQSHSDERTLVGAEGPGGIIRTTEFSVCDNGIGSDKGNLGSFETVKTGGL